MNGRKILKGESDSAKRVGVGKGDARRVSEGSKEQEGVKP